MDRRIPWQRLPEMARWQTRSRQTGRAPVRTNIQGTRVPDGSAHLWRLDQFKHGTARAHLVEGRGAEFQDPLDKPLVPRHHGSHRHTAEKGQMVVMFALVIRLAVLSIVMFIMMIRLRSIMHFNEMLTMSLLMTVDNYRCEPGSRERIEGDTDHHEKAKTSRAGQSAEAGSALPHRRRERVSLFSISHDEVSSARRAGRSWRHSSLLARLQGSNRMGTFQIWTSQKRTKTRRLGPAKTSRNSVSADQCL